MSHPLAGTLFDLSGTVTLITGSTKGMGLAMAQRFVQHGSRVVVSSRSQTDCDATAAALNAAAQHDVAIGIAADLLDVASLERLVDASVEHFGRLDTLICNAAVLSFGREADVTPDQFTEALNGNIRNNYLLCQRAIPHLKKSGRGNIILTGSVAGLKATETMSVYGIAKRGLLQLMENMALYLGQDKIRVNAICPGFIRTEGTRGIWSDAAGLRAGKASSPLGRIGEGDDIAGCALFLASAAGNFTTGQSICVDGGSLLTGGISSNVSPDELVEH